MRGTGSDRGRAVSPVIGVILVVAITVILAAVVGVSVMGLTEEQEIAPQAHWSEDEYYDDSGQLEEVTIRHNGGEPITKDDIWLRVDGQEVADGSVSPGSISGVSGHTWPSGAEITAGGEFHIEFDGTLDAGDEIWIVWDPDDPDVEDSYVIYKYEIPADTTTP